MIESVKYMEKKFSLILPNNNCSNKEIETTTSLLFVGANGSGKTRLGTWIEMESPQKDKVHRISAQKSLTMPDTTTPMSIDRAEKDLLFGNADGAWGHKQGHKWQSKPAIALLNDYQKLMVYLFSDYTEECAKYHSASKASTMRIEPPITKLDLVKTAWEKILPHRELVLGGLRIQTKVTGSQDKIYNSSEMSDGERVIFYLIGQCLAAPKDGIIIIDEPELHLHKSVQAPLWSEIEKLRSDCLFVYLTHDVDFAAAQETAMRVWLKSFDGQTWEWEVIADDKNLPDDLLIEVLGSRKPVVFVEGENGSYDVSFYREVLSNHLVIPRGSCTQVIQSVKALKANAQIHHLDVFGLIDRDRRVDQEILALEQDSIFVLKVAEVENLFCTKEILEVVCKRLGRDHNNDFSSIATFVFKRLQDELDTQVSLRTASEIKFLLNNFDDKAKGSNGLNAALQALTNGINVASIYSDIESEFKKVLSQNDYEELLRLYNRKSLSAQVSNALGLAKDNSLPELVVRLVRGDCRSEIIQAVKKYFGDFGQHLA
jgi:Protein of unknown function (DUF4435)/AAA domain, putative AbiEii toxin, Type IV TA system